MKDLLVKITQNKRLLIGAIALFAALLIAGGLLISGSVHKQAASAQPTSTPTDEPPNELTVKHGDEVSDLINNFELEAHTVKMYKDEDYHATLYTGPYLDYINGYYMSFDETTIWPIVSQATVTRIKVVEYTDEKIRALACITEQKLDLNYKGELLSQEAPEVVNGAYVFVREDGVWKVGSFLNMSEPESAKLEYGMMDDDLRTITGDYKSLTGFYCSTAQ